MKVRHIVLASAVSCSLGSLAFAQQGQEGMPTQQEDQSTGQSQSMEQDRSQAGHPQSGLKPGEPEAQYQAGQGQEGPGADVTAEKEGAHSPPSSQISSDTVRQVQQKLNEEGYQVGPVDGIWGPKTESAIKNFQQAKGMEATGTLNEDTLAELNIEGQPMTGAAGEGAQEGAGTETGAAEQPGQDEPPAGQEPQQPGQSQSQ